MKNILHFRKANINDVDKLVELRKRQLIDESSCSDNDIDAEGFMTKKL